MPDLQPIVPTPAAPVPSAGAGSGASANLPVVAPVSAPVPPGSGNPTIEKTSQAEQRNPAPQAAPVPSPSSVPVTDDSDENAELPPLSPVAFAFVTSDYYTNVNNRLAADFGLTADDVSFLGEMDHLVLSGSLPLDGYVRGLRGEFTNLSDEQREKLIARLLAEHFLPWDTNISPSAQQVARSEKLILPGTAYYRVYPHPITYGGAAAELARAVDIAPQGQVNDRLRDLVMSRAKGIRVDAQVEEQLRRPADMGGLGLSPEKARGAVIAMNDIISRAKLVTEDDYSAWLAAEARKKDEANRKPAPPKGVSTAEDDEDAKEIAAIAKNMPAPVRDTSSVLALSTQTLLNRLSTKPTSDYLMRRLENLVSTRLRDVRSKAEVLAKLTRDEKVGGVGMDRASAEKIVGEIEEGYNEFHGLIADEEKNQRESMTAAHTKKVEERKQREAEEHARWYQEKIQGKKMEEEARKDMVERMKVVAQGFTNPMTAAPHPVDIKEQAKEKKELGDLVPAASVVVPAAAVLAPKPSLPVASGPVEAPAPAAPTMPARPAPVAPPVVRVSAETAKAAQAEQGTIRPRMDDVKVVRTRLEGPLQEIEGLTLASFRRLGRTPEECAVRVEEKIELLGQESFEKHIQGIQAWQASPLQKSYLTLVAGAFSSSTPVNALAEKKRAAGEDVPSPEEIAAIVGLNGRLHF
jgi:hypothetical protein